MFSTTGLVSPGPTAKPTTKKEVITMSTKTTPVALDAVENLDQTTGELTEVPALNVPELAEKYLHADGLAKYWAAEAKALKEVLAALPIGKHEAGEHLVTVRAGSKLVDAKAVEAAKPKNEYPLLYKTVFDLDAAKNLIAPIELEFYKVQGNPVVTVK